MVINNLYDVSILVGETDILDSGYASQVNCVVEETAYNSIPTCKITFLSSVDFIGKKPIVDGTRVIIKIVSDTLSINEIWNFRVMNIQAIPSNNNMVFSLECVIDFYDFFRTPIKYTLNNNSSEIFKLISEQNNLYGSKIYKTQDKQLWAPSESNLYQWLNYVSQHAWASPQSGFYWCMNRNKQLFFIDIDRLIYETKNMPIFQYGDFRTTDVSDNIIRYKDIAINMQPGTENIFNRGYDGENNHFDLLSYSTKTVNANKVRAASEIVNINKELSAGLGKNLLQFDVGNHHENFFVSEAQNRRVLSTFSTYISLTCEHFMPVKLSGVYSIEGRSHNSANGSVDSINIKYIIGKTSIKINSSRISMDVELCSQGYNGTSFESY